MLPLHLANRSPLRVLLCGLMRRVIHEPAAASRAVSGALPMALLRKYWVFNLLHAVTVPTQTSARLVEPMGLEPTTFSLQGNCAPNCATAPYCAFAQMVRFFVG